MAEHSKKTGYKKLGEYMEIRISGKSSYNSVAEECQQIMELSGKGDLTLFRADGTVIPRKGFNTISGYFECMKKTPAQIKLGIGYVRKVIIVLCMFVQCVLSVC